jgi:hypothetical protein
MANSTEHLINQVKPKLSLIAPLTSFICWCYVLVNTVLGFGMMFLYSTPVPIAVANILPYGVWGGLFILTAISRAYGLMRNDWEFIKKSQLVGLLLKSTWAVALIVRCFSAPQTILITAVWLFLTAIEAGTYIYFLPPRLDTDGR